jgi:kinesin family member 2/24
MKGIQKIEADREARRAKMQQMKEAKEERKLANQAAGKVNDVEYDMLIDQNKANVGAALNHVSATEMNICICVRKRPLFDKEYNMGEIDAVSTSNPNVVVHEPKVKVDGITKYVQDTSFQFDNTFNENENSQDMYQFSIRDLLPSIFENGIVTCFAYGQTGSGKTFTVNAITKYAINDIFKHAQGKSNIEFYMSMFEIYGGKCMDLLNNKKKL